MPASCMATCADYMQESQCSVIGNLVVVNALQRHPDICWRVVVEPRYWRQVNMVGASIMSGRMTDKGAILLIAMPSL